MNLLPCVLLRLHLCASLGVDFSLSLLLDKFLLLFHPLLCDLILDCREMLTLNVLLNELLLLKLLMKNQPPMGIVLPFLCVSQVFLHLLYRSDFVHMLVVNLLLLVKRRSL